MARLFMAFHLLAAVSLAAGGAQAFEKDPEFYSFLRTLEAYKKSLTKDATVVLSGDSEFFQYLSPPEKK